MEDGEGSKKKDPGGGDGGDSREAESIKIEPPDEPNPSVSPARCTFDVGEVLILFRVAAHCSLFNAVFDNVF
jgi:hypothetical protein